MEFLKKYTKNTLGEHTLLCQNTGVEQSVKLDMLPVNLQNLVMPFFAGYAELVNIKDNCSLSGFEVSTKDGDTFLRVSIDMQIGDVYHQCKGSKIRFNYTTPNRVKENEIKLQAAIQINDENEIKYLNGTITKSQKTNGLIELYQSISTWVEDNWLKLLHVDTNQLEIFKANGEPANQ